MKGHLVNKKQSQSGSAHLVIIIVLVIALLGALGYVFYINFMQPKSTPAPTPEVAVVSTPTPTPTETNAGYLVLDDWDVKFKLPTNLGSNVITNQKATDANGEDYYKFSTERVSALGGDCTSLSKLYRMTELIAPDASPPILVGKFGGYYYYARNSQAICAEDKNIDGNIQFEDIHMLKAFLNTIEPK